MASMSPKQHLVIRRAQLSDVAVVHEFISCLEDNIFDFREFETIFETNLRSRSSDYYLASLNDKVLGFASAHYQLLLHHNGLVCEIQELFIRPEYRGNGIGKMLVGKCVDRALAKKCKSIEVTSNLKRKNVVRFYSDLGFSLTHNKLTR